ncbi:hypothetical protein [Nocardia miyunensis]|uniref:hypothetical protein n=1 Tax=Nocardia miyunensis TaxID=282684 RepID=UPI00082BA803|nr:hypothetical protein [Nocardia miyunensis]
MRRIVGPVVDPADKAHTSTEMAGAIDSEFRERDIYADEHAFSAANVDAFLCEHVTLHIANSRRTG